MSLGTTTPKINQQGKHFFPFNCVLFKSKWESAFILSGKKQTEVFLTVVLTQANKLQEECLIIIHFQPNPQITDS